MLFSAGDQVPVILLVEVVGNAFKAVPAQIGFTAVKAGVAGWFTVMVSVAVPTHVCPAVGIKV